MTSILVPLAAVFANTFLAAVPVQEDKSTKTPANYILLAAMVGDGGDLSKAETILRDGMKEFPTAGGMHLVLGQILEKKGHTADAFYEYQWEVALSGAESQPGDVASQRTAMVMEKPSPDRAEILAVMHALAQSQADPAAARATLDSIERTRGRRTVLDLFRAEIASLAGDDARAVAAFRQTLEDAPTLVPAWIELSTLLAKQGKADEAKAAFEKGRSIDPNSWRLSERQDR